MAEIQEKKKQLAKGVLEGYSIIFSLRDEYYCSEYNFVFPLSKGHEAKREQADLARLEVFVQFGRRTTK